MANRKRANENPMAAQAVKLRAGKKERAAFYLPVEVIERGRRAVYWTDGVTFSDLAAQAISEHVDRMERKRGAAFDPIPPKKGLLRGRPPAHQ